MIINLKVLKMKKIIRIGIYIIPIICFTFIGALFIPIDGSPAYELVGNEENANDAPSIPINTIPNSAVITDIDLLSRYDDIGRPSSFVIENDLIFLASGDIGLTVYNISDPDNLIEIGNFYNGGVVVDIQLFDSNIAYLLNPDNGIEIVSIFDPSNIYLVNTYNEFTSDQIFWARSITIADNLCFLSYCDEDLVILDITNPVHPVKVYESLPGYWEWTYTDYKENIVSNNYLFFSDGHSEISVYDIENPAEPEKIAYYSCVDLHDFHIENDLIYISYGNILKVFNFTAESGFEELHHFELGFDIEFFEISHLGNLIMFSSEKLYVYDFNYVTDTLIFVNVIDVEGPYWGYRYELQISNDFTYLLDYQGRLNIFNNNLILSGDLYSKTDFLGGGSRSMLFNEEILITTLREGGIQILNISNKFEQKLISEYVDDSIIRDANFYESTLYAATNEGLKIFNISENFDLTLLNTSYEENSYNEVLLDYPIIYLTSDTNLTTLDISNLTSPNYMDSFFFGSGEELKNLELCQDFVVFSSLKQVWIINNTNPYNLTVLSLLSDFTTYDDRVEHLHIFNNSLYASDFNFIHVFDIEDPSNPQYIKIINLGFQTLEGDFILQNDLLFAANMHYVYVINMSTEVPNILRVSPSYVSDSGFALSGYCQLVILGEILIITDSVWGVLIFDLKFDNDNDNLSNFQEENVYFTDPELSDTDGDYLTDGQEVLLYNTNPLSYDTDNDMINDYFEIFIFGTDPNNPDSDGDGISDFLEIIENWDDDCECDDCDCECDDPPAEAPPAAPLSNIPGYGIFELLLVVFFSISFLIIKKRKKI